ncbi:FtsX-like permease family protein [Nocardioides conyzicola]|uniref:ABC3 transporter permease C-terminal domain-containing protein n=1 Tax=Nocardioides conyzicola TaxID=1651781 RepID=A0ABP8WT55_9ACTN
MTSLLLGLRLSVTPAARLRTALLALAAATGSTILLVTFAAGHHQLVTATSYQAEMPRLVLVIVTVVALPCTVLVATVARLSASVRDRRLANLRLIGLSPNQTRLVGTGEAGGAAVVGTLLGWGLFWLVRPLLLGHSPAGAAWGDFFAPTVRDQVLVVVGVPAVAILASVLPARSSVGDALARSRRADRRPPGWWRLLPLAVGGALCLVVVASGPHDDDISDGLTAALFGGIVLTAVGMLLVLPVLVRLLTRLTSGRALGPAQRIAVRRLEAQPAGVARIIGALLIGLFLATGARFVLVAFESTDEYAQAARNHDVEQRVEVVTNERHVDTVLAGLMRTDGVSGAVDLPMLHNNRLGMEAVVATCAQLAAAAPEITGCRDGEPMWLHDHSGIDETGTVAWRTGDVHGRRVATTDLALVSTSVEQPSYDALSPVYADVIIPPTMVAPLPPDAWHSVLVVGPPGPDLASRLADLGYAPSYFGTEDYEFVATMRSVIWIVAGVVLGVGLLALTVSAIDRAVQRRKEVVALQLVGLGRGVIRRAQALETAVPVTVGAVLAVGLGSLAGATYLSVDDSTTIPWAQSLVLAAVAVVGGLGVAAVTMVAAAPRLRAEEIRAE